ncbi:MAG: hypothetical protein ACTHMA_18140 [Thermomicrobiales bacterium]
MVDVQDIKRTAKNLPPWAIPVGVGGALGLVVLLSRKGKGATAQQGGISADTAQNPVNAGQAGNVYLPPAAVSSDATAQYPADTLQSLLQQLQLLGQQNTQAGGGSGDTSGSTGGGMTGGDMPPIPAPVVSPPTVTPPPPTTTPPPPPAMTPPPTVGPPTVTPPPIQNPPNPTGYVKAPPPTQYWQPNGWIPNWLPDGSFLYPNGSKTPAWDSSIILTRRGTAVRVPSFYDTHKPGYHNNLYPYGDHYHYDNYGVIRDRLSDIEEKGAGTWAARSGNPSDPYNIYIIFRGALHSMVTSPDYPGGDPANVTGWTSAPFFLA